MLTSLAPASLTLTVEPLAERIDGNDGCRSCRIWRETRPDYPNRGPALYRVTMLCSTCGPRTGNVCEFHAARLRMRGGCCVTCGAFDPHRPSPANMTVTAIGSRP